ncbi:hypothetical protein GT487_06000, partial [Enterococcus durans]|nr:hypothetical protein [Enterococcus durans]
MDSYSLLIPNNLFSFFTPERARLGQKCLTPRNKKKFTKNAFQIFVNFGLFPKELLLLPPFIRESVANLIFRFVPHSFLRLVKYFFLLVFIKKKVYEISLI